MSLPFLNPVKVNVRLVLQTFLTYRPHASQRDILPPRIPTRSRHYDYAVLIVAGVPSADAVREMNINERTAEGWRRELRQTAAEYFGRPVSYEFAARYALDEAWRQLVDKPHQPH